MLEDPGLFDPNLTGALSPEGWKIPTKSHYVIGFKYSGIEEYEDHYWLNHLEDNNYELWIEMSSIISSKTGVVIRKKLSSSDDHKTASIKLLAEDLTNRGLLPNYIDKSGIITKSDWNLVEQEVMKYTASPKMINHSSILTLAKELSLNPTPIIGNKPLFQAQCPSRNHQLHLHPDKNEWFCGYCKINGGEDELKQLKNR